MAGDLSDEIPLARTVLAEKRLYKFRSLASAEQKDWVKDIVLGNRIRFSRPSELNDPIEGKPIFCLGDCESKNYRDQFEEWVWNTQHHVKDRPPKQVFMAWLRKLSKKDHEGYIEEIVKENQAAIEARWRILSFSANPVHDLLWSHYADSHRGVALVFDASGGEFGIAFKVEYVAERTPLEISTQDGVSILRAAALTKRAAWAYEDEYRCLASEHGDQTLNLHEQFLTFDPCRLLGVILGANCAQSDKEAIIGWSKKRPVPLTIFQAAISINGSVMVAPYAP